MAEEHPTIIKADSIGKTACPKCGNVVDAGDAPAFSVVQCPQCKTKFATPGRLGLFVLLKELGRGQMGVTYKALEQTLGRYVAIKVMHESLGRDPERVREFFAEGRALASLDHPNAVRIFSLGQEKGQPYIVMELVNGRSMGRMFSRGRPMNEARTLEIATGVARALLAASEIGLVHGDVKPDNIVLEDKGRAKLVDFGIARFGVGKAGRDDAVGTPYYIAPEQVLRGPVDHRTDIYSLGATMFHALAGVPPFPGTVLTEVLNARLERPAPNLLKLRDSLHLETAGVVARMLEKDPDKRYQSHNGLIQDLRKACRATGAELTEDGDEAPVALAAAPAGNGLNKALLAAFILLALAGAAAWAVFLRNGDSPVGANATSRPVNRVAKPIFSPRGRKISGPTKIVASCDTAEAMIHYTDNGQEPTRKSKRWPGSITVQPGTTLRARAFRSGFDPSEVIEAVYARDSVVLADVVGIRTEAEATWRQVKGLNAEQGFDAKLEEGAKLLSQASELYAKEAYAAARGPYMELLSLSRRLKTAESARAAAISARKGADEAVRSVPDFGTVDKPAGPWVQVAKTAADAASAFKRGDFTRARSSWVRVAGKIVERYKTMLPGARDAYQGVLTKLDQDILKKHGGQAWETVRKTAEQAKTAAAGGQYGKAVILYKKATGLLSEANRIAKTAASAARTTAAIARMNALVSSGRYYQAQKVIGSLPGAVANDPKLVALKNAIAAAVNVTLAIRGVKFDMKLVYVEPGRFKMGSPAGESGRARDERHHEVEITRPFYIGKFEVTREQFECFVKAASYKTSAEATGWATALSKSGKIQKIRGASWRVPGFDQKADHPVVCVSYDDAMAFCSWMSGRFPGLTVTLPTEAQWELACRAGTTTRFVFGANSDDLHRNGNYADGSTSFAWGDSKFSDGHPATSSVGFFDKTRRKKLRISDMHGNAAEWCLDWYGPYSRGTDGKPAVDPTGMARGALRVVRGGSWASAPAKCRSASRARLAPSAPTAAVGFRVVATGKPPTQAAIAAATAKAKPLTGRVGLGTFNTAADFKDIVVTQGNRQLFVANAAPKSAWKAVGGTWGIRRGVVTSVHQDALQGNQFLVFGDAKWANYTISLKARKTGGKEGFFIRFGDNQKGQIYHWNVGGRGNTKYVIGRQVRGRRREALTEVKGSVDLNRWYDIRVELKGTVINCYLDNKLIQTLDTSTLGK